MPGRHPPPFIVAQVRFRCPSIGTKTFEIVGPSADQALRKAADFDVHAPGVPKYIRFCRPAGVALVQRGTRAGLQGAMLGGARGRRRRRRRAR